jgi:hypothetical protein
VFALINQNDVLDLKFDNIGAPACVLSLFDDLDVKELLITFQTFSLDIGREAAWRSRSAGMCI